MCLFKHGRLFSCLETARSTQARSMQISDPRIMGLLWFCHWRMALIAHRQPHHAAAPKCRNGLAIRPAHQA
jgi:hypothetical protein